MTLDAESNLSAQTSLAWGLYFIGMAVALGWEGNADWIGLGIIGTGIAVALRD